MPTLFFIAWFSVSPHALFALLEGTKAFSNGLFPLGCSSLSAGLVCQVWSHRSCRRNFHFFPPLTLAFISVEHHSQSYYWKCLAPSDVCNSPVQPWQAWLQKCSLILPCDCTFVQFLTIHYSIHCRQCPLTALHTGHCSGCSLALTASWHILPGPNWAAQIQSGWILAPLRGFWDQLQV